MWQKCPVCNGSGKGPGIYSALNCPTCKGSRILNELTGLPPKVISADNSQESNLGKQMLDIENGKIIDK